MPNKLEQLEFKLEFFLREGFRKMQEKLEKLKMVFCCLKLFLPFAV